MHIVLCTVYLHLFFAYYQLIWEIEHQSNTEAIKHMFYFCQKILSMVTILLRNVFKAEFQEHSSFFHWWDPFYGLDEQWSGAQMIQFWWVARWRNTKVPLTIFSLFDKVCNEHELSDVQVILIKRKNNAKIILFSSKPNSSKQTFFLGF